MSFQNLKDATKDIDVIVGSGIEMVDSYSIVSPYFEELHDLAYSDMLSQMIVDRLKKGNATEEEIGNEFGVDDIEKQLEYLVKKKLVVRNSDGSYSLDLT